MFWNTLKNLDWLLIVAVFLLSGFGLLTIYSTGNFGAVYFEKQIVWLAVGFVLMLALSFLDYRIFKNYSYLAFLIYLLAIFLLIALLIFGTPIRGSAAWFRFGGISFEPVELVKIILIIVLAKYFSLRHIEIYRWNHFIISAAYTAIPVGLVLAQPDLGSAVILSTIWFGLIMVAGIKFKHLAVLFILLAFVFSFSWTYVLKDYQRARLTSFIAPQNDPQGAGYHILQSTIAIGSGGFFGKGLGRGTQSQLNFLPEQHTDFIFAAIAEEWGFLGSLSLISLIGFIFWRLLKIILAVPNNFSKLFISGFIVLILSQSIVNIGMNLGLLPITGIPLPFVSYGGSNLLSNFLALGLIQSIKIRTGLEKDED